MWLSNHLRGMLMVFLAAGVARCGWEAAPGLTDWAVGFWMENMTPLVEETMADWNDGGFASRLMIMVAVCGVLLIGFYLLSLILYFVSHPLESIGIVFEKLNDGITCIIDDISYRRKRRTKEQALKDGDGTPVATLEKPDLHTAGTEAATV